ncbi:MAG: lysylphosphatidylglycerol synthetase-like protein (DUF2156 family) [Polaribacter sp.]|jgi:lysylphosphatidylglycerol synthetase-like protein (DUF2156 family)
MEQQTINPFDQFVAQHTPEIDPITFITNLAITFVLATLLGLLYSRYGNSLSNKKMFASNFELIALTTMIIITIVKSSLALSLGLVGALSIVRFRAAIKEPEELAYIFLTIAIGLGLGANQVAITTVGFLFVCLVVWLKSMFVKPRAKNKSLNFTVLANKNLNLSLDNIVDTLSPHCKDLELKRLDENSEFMEASFLVEFSNFGKLSAARTALMGLNNGLQINFLDQKGIL